MEGMTAQYALNRQPATAPGAKPVYSLDGITRTGRLKTTDWWKEGRNESAVTSN